MIIMFMVTYTWIIIMIIMTIIVKLITIKIIM